MSLACALGAGTLVAGCGGGDDDGGRQARLVRPGTPSCAGTGALACRVTVTRARVSLRYPLTWRLRSKSASRAHFTLPEGNCTITVRRAKPPSNLDTAIRRARAAGNEGGASDTYGLVRVSRERAGSLAGIGQVLFLGDRFNRSILVYRPRDAVKLECAIGRDTFADFDNVVFKPVLRTMRFGR